MTTPDLEKDEAEASAGLLGGYEWDCPNCGERITSWTKPPALAAPATPPLTVDPTIWTWYGDWPGFRCGAGDGWLHVHPDGTRWVHPKKACAFLAALADRR